jgi:hypothetical protein
MTIVFQRDSVNIAVRTAGDTPVCRVDATLGAAFFESCDQTNERIDASGMTVWTESRGKIAREGTVTVWSVGSSSKDGS